MPSEQFIVKSKFPGYEIPNISVGEFLLGKIQKAIEANPAKIALISALTDASLTFQQLHDQAHEVANGFLNASSIAPNFSSISSRADLCMFFGDNHPEYVVLLLALAYLGIPITPSTPANGAYETCMQLNSSGARILLATKNKLPILEQILNDAAHAPSVANLKMLLIIDSDEIPQAIANHPSAPKQILTFNQLRAAGAGQKLAQIPHFTVDPKKDTHMIVYTSGSTGLPKGAVQTHRSYIASVMAMLHKNAFVKNIGGVINFTFPLGHISGSVFVMNCLSSQMSLVLFGDVTSHPVIVSAIPKYHVSVAIVTLALSADLIKNDELSSKYDLSSLRSMYFSGSRLPEAIANGLISKFGIRMYEVYGATEYMGSVTNNGDYEAGKIGAPLPNTEMKIIDLETGDSLPAGKEGEVCFRGPNCFAGYLNNEKATKETIDENGWYHSGDVGFYDQDDCLRITDRIKELIKYKHWTVAPAEIEGFLQTHPAISGACVVGVPHALKSEGQHSRAYVLLAEGKSATEEEIIKFVKDNMGYQKRLNGGVRFVTSIPRIAMGKINRQYFKQLVKDELLTEEAEKE